MNDDLLQLMTAALDGELPAAEAGRLRALLETSAEARTLFAQLRHDAQRLRSLPLVRPPADLKRRIMARLASAPPASPATPARPWAEPVAPRAYRRDCRSLLPYAVAVAVLVVVSTGSFLFFLDDPAAPRSRSSQRRPSTARLGPGEPRLADQLPTANDPRPAASSPTPRPAPPLLDPSAQSPPVDDAPPAATRSGSLALAPEPRPLRSPLVGSGFIPDTRFDRIDVRVPFLKSLVDFEQNEVRREFAAELNRENAYRIDVFVRNPARSVELLRDAARSGGVSLLADATSLGLVQKRQVHAVAVYTESLSPGELATLLARLSQEDAKVSPRVFGSVHAVPASTADAADLRSLLGFDPGLFRRPNRDRPDTEPKPHGTGGPLHDPTTPLSAGTADHIIKSVGSAASAGQGSVKTAVLLTWQPLALRTPPTASAELKQFLAKRGERRPEAVPVLFILRPGS